VARQMPRVRESCRWLCLMVLLACADSPRENIVDPVNAPTIEMSAPVLDGGAMLIEWRYLTEGSVVDYFLVRRLIPGVPAEDLGTVQAELGASSEFRTATFRDTTLIAGVPIHYEVLAILPGGERSASVISSSIQLDGTRLQSAVADPELLQIVVTWANPPVGTAGFVLLRRTASGGEDRIFDTDNPLATTYIDENPKGNTVYTYALSTLLEGGAVLQSVSLEAGLFADGVKYVVSESGEATPGVDTGSRTFLTWHAQWPRELIALFAGTQGLFWHSVGGVVGFRVTESVVLSGGDYSPSSLSILGGSTTLSSLYPSRLLWTAGLSKLGNDVHINVADYDSTYAEISLPASGGAKTGMTLLGHTGTANRVVLFEGSVLRELDDSLRVLGEMAIASGEPIDIDYMDGSIWLAYPNRLLKSNPAAAVEDVTSWDAVAFPDDIQLTAMTRFGERMVILDAHSEEVHLMDLEGNVLLSWGAKGNDIANGDITTDKDADLLYQADGEGVIYVILPAGVLP
jgi:hypothetical protein